MNVILARMDPVCLSPFSHCFCLPLSRRVESSNIKLITIQIELIVYTVMLVRIRDMIIRNRDMIVCAIDTVCSYTSQYAKQRHHQ